LKHGKFGPKCLFLGNSDIQTNKMWTGQKPLIKHQIHFLMISRAKGLPERQL
jgi:hypothetical protein